MKKIFIAFIFIFFDFTISFENGQILSLLPTCIGYWFLIKGLMELKEKSVSCAKMIPWAKWEMGIATIIWVTNLMGLQLQMIIISLVSTILNYYITYKVVKGIGEVGEYHNRDIHANELKTAWIINIIASILNAVCSVLPLVNIVMSLVGFGVYVYILITMNRVKKAYQAILIEETIEK